MTPAIDRALAKRTIVQHAHVEGPCWIFNGARKGQPRAEEPDNDHRKIRVYDETRGRWVLDYVHRVSHRHYHGAIPDGMVVRHRCDRRACFAPHHLELGDLKQNFRDGIERGRVRPFVCNSNVAPKASDDCPF